MRQLWALIVQTFSLYQAVWKWFHFGIYSRQEQRTLAEIHSVLRILYMLWNLDMTSIHMDNNIQAMYTEYLRTYGVSAGNARSLSLLAVHRHFVISHLPKLHFLDDSAVSPEEREAAERVYGRRRVLQGNKENPPQVRMFSGFWYLVVAEVLCKSCYLKLVMIEKNKCFLVRK